MKKLLIAISLVTLSGAASAASQTFLIGGGNWDSEQGSWNISSTLQAAPTFGTTVYDPIAWHAAGGSRLLIPCGLVQQLESLTGIPLALPA